MEILEIEIIFFIETHIPQPTSSYKFKIEYIRQ